MKQILYQQAACFAAAFLLPIAPAAAQATIGFANGPSSAITNGLTWQRVPVGGPFLVVLYSAAIGQPESSFVQIAGPVAITTSPGLFNGGNVPVLGLTAGQSAQFQVRVWDSTVAATWAAASANTLVLKSKSTVVIAMAGTSLANSGMKIPPLTSADCLDIQCQAGTITVPPECGGCAPVNFTVTVSNRCMGTVTYSCSHSSGGCFTNATVTPVTCTATDTNGNYKSCSFTIKVDSPITTFGAGPQNLATTTGGSATFLASPSNALPVTLQWRRNGQLLPGATNASYTINGATKSDEGSYTIEVSDPCGGMSTKSGSLTVLNAPGSGSLIAAGGNWRYFFSGSDPGPGWAARNFDDSTWAGGLAQLGFGENDEATVIGNDTNGYITAYFRRPFLVPNPAAATNLAIALQRDDGGIVYVNGVEVFRSNMPTGQVTHLTLASNFDPNDGQGFHVAPVNPAVLVSGTNLLAVEIHQYAVDSSDMSFDLQLVSQSALANARLAVGRAGSNVTLSWSNALLRLQAASQLQSPSSNIVWTDIAGGSPMTNAPTGSRRHFRLIWP